MSWTRLTVAPDRSHHVLEDGTPAYEERFAEVLKFHAPGLAPVRRGAAAWHITADGSPAYPRRFGRTFGFYEGRAVVMGKHGWHHIDTSGGDAYRQRYSWCGNFQGQRCTVREAAGGYFHIDYKGQPIYAQRWRYAGDYRDGIAVVQGDDGLHTHIDDTGALVHGRWFVDLDVFHKGFARARDEAGWMHIDVRGRPIYAHRFAMVEPFYNGQARVAGCDGALAVIDEAGATVVELRPPQRSEFAALSGDMVGFWRTQTIATAVELGLFTALPGSADEVAQRCGLQPDGARRLLRALGELSLVVRRDVTWQRTGRGEFLLADHPLTLADAAREYAGPLSRMWECLADALRADSHWAAPDVFGAVAQDEKRRQGHHRMLRSYARHDYPLLPAALALGGGERIIDAGGGLGTLARLILDAYPSVEVTVFDRPEVIEQGRCEPDQRPGLHWHSGDIFAPWGMNVDVVVLSRVLHDWNDEAATRILKRARAALPRGGSLLVVEMLLPEGGVAGALCDLHLLMATGGRERTAAEYQRLMGDAGFASAGVHTIAALPSVLMGVAQ